MITKGENIPRKEEKLFKAIAKYARFKFGDICKDGCMISVSKDDVVNLPHIRTIRIKLSFLDRRELEREERRIARKNKRKQKEK